ncbi:MAG: YjgP/YjgQ family permease [Nitrospiraceae bacterium]|nr:MAG: YjgP/YjgQ family permease [Nitrospiraceae bacterium]
MKIIRQYFLREFIKYFLFLLAGFTSIAVIAEFFDKMNEFYAHKPPFFVIAQYLLLQTPGVMLYALPFASLFSVLITIGIASKWREIIVIKASGSSTKRLFSNFLTVGLILSLSALLLGETLVPAAVRKAAWVRKVKILNESPKIAYREGALWLKGLDKSLIRIGGFVEGENRVVKTSIFSFNPAFGLEKRTEADEATWANGVWSLKNVTVFDFVNNTTKRYDSLTSVALEDPRIFNEEMQKPAEMNFIELYEYYSRLEKAGFKNLKYVVRLYEKLSYPAINFIMMLFGISLALNSRWGGGIKAAGLGVLVSVVYWLLYSINISLGNTGVLSPWLATWITPALFTLAGSFMYLKIRD